MSSLPEHLPSGVLPPYVGDNPATARSFSPYRVSIAEFVSRFGWNDRRRAILAGFLSYRRELRSLGLVDAQQWCAGSFVDSGEQPGDVDIVTLYVSPWTTAEKVALLERRPDVFRAPSAKQSYQCDAYFFEANTTPPWENLRLLNYFFGLFTHQRATSAWRGIVQIPLTTIDEDQEARDILDGKAVYGT